MKRAPNHPAKKPAKREPAKPPEISPADRAFYREAWGFDPVAECMRLRGGQYRYETGFPLHNDPGLAATGVRVAARVDFSTRGEVKNRIVFYRVKQEAVVECTHTVAYAGPAQDALTLGDDQLVRDRFLARDVQAMVKRAGGPVALPPWEHFVALKSYVAAVAEAGIGNMLRAAWAAGHRNDAGEEKVPILQLPFGFNSAMQVQVLRAIVDVAPAAGRSLVVEWGLELLDTAPAAWLAEQLGTLEKLTDNASSASKYEDDHPEVLKPAQEVLLAWLVDRLPAMPADWWEPRRRFLYDITTAAFPFPYLEPQDIGHVDGLVPFERYGDGAALQALVNRQGRDWAIAHRPQVLAAFGDTKDVREWVVPAIMWRGRPIPVNGGKVELRGIADLCDVDFGAVAEKIRELDLSRGRIERVENLDTLVNLEKLNLSENAIRKIEGLDRLTCLRELRLEVNQISKIEGLQQLTELRKLNLNHNPISRIESLGAQLKLETLWLTNNAITNLEGLDNLRNLRGLFLGGNKISKIQGLTQLSELHALSIEHSQIEEIQGLDSLSKLESLAMEYNNIKHISNLTGLTGLRRLNLEHNQIEEIQGLDSLSKLEFLELDYNNIEQVSNLTGFTQLKRLNLERNKISVFEGLNELKNLQELYLSFNYISTMLGMERLKSLHILKCDNNQLAGVPNLTACESLQDLRIYNNKLRLVDGTNLPTQLKEFSLANNNIEEISNLGHLQGLEYIDLTNNQVGDIGGLSGLQNLEILYLEVNPVRQVEGLANLQKLKILSLSNTMVEDLAPLANLGNLKILYLQSLCLDSLAPLNKLEKLETLDLRGSKVRHKEGQESLAKVKGPDGRRALLALPAGN